MSAKKVWFAWCLITCIASTEAHTIVNQIHLHEHQRPTQNTHAATQATFKMLYRHAPVLSGALIALIKIGDYATYHDVAKDLSIPLACIDLSLSVFVVYHGISCLQKYLLNPFIESWQDGFYETQQQR